MDIEPILAAVRSALAPDATPEQRAAGAVAARAILAVLEPSAPPPPSAPAGASPPPPVSPSGLAGVLHDVLAHVQRATPEQRAQLRNVAPEQLLDVAIARLRAALPDGTTAPPPAFNVRLVGVPGSTAASKGGS